jgi:mannose/cellobiose epimerase-like protein (N-acyl-D-glucosamine 2-epimerase family)
MSFEGLLGALDKLAVFLDECHGRYDRSGSGSRVWKFWAKYFRDWRNALNVASEAEDNTAIHRALKAIQDGVSEKGLMDNIIWDSKERVTVEEMNKPLTREERESNRRMKALVDDVEMHLAQLSKST